MLALALILLTGFTLRVWNINFDQGLGVHPDERSTVCFYAATIALPASWEDFWDPRLSPLNPLWDPQQQRPRSFTYGHLPLYAGVAMGHIFAQVAPLAAAIGAPPALVELLQGGQTACDALAVAGRLTIALLDTLTILLLYLLGTRLIGHAGGLLSAAGYAVTAQAIQLSHFFAMDPASTTFVVLAVLLGMTMLDTQRLRPAVLTGIACGLAIASKFSALPILAAPAVAALLFVWRARITRRHEGRSLGARVPLRALALMVTAWSVAGLTVFITSPYVILDWANFSRAVLVEQGMMVRGVADYPFTRQYRDTLPYLYFIQQQLQWGLGWPLGLVALAGTGYALARLIRTLAHLVRAWFGGKREWGQPTWLTDTELGMLLTWSWVLPYFLITGAFLAKFNRYMSPILPFVILWGAWLILTLWRQGARRTQVSVGDHQAPLADAATAAPGADHGRIPWRRVTARWSAVGLAVLGLVGGGGWSLAYVNGVYGHEHTWITASRWIYQQAPRGSVILWELWELWDDPLPKTIPGEPGMDLGSAGLTHIDWSPYEEDTEAKYLILRQKLNEADFVVYSSKRIYASVAKLPQRYPLTNRYYQAMRDGRLGFELAAEVTSPPRLAGLVFDDRHADESFSLYDHPQVSIFRKTRALSEAEIDAVLAGSWEGAIHYDRGPDSPLSPVLEALGLGRSTTPGSPSWMTRLIAAADTKSEQDARAPAVEPPSLLLATPISELPPLENHRWNGLASTSTVLAILSWWAALTLLGWLSWPLLFAICQPLRDAGFMLSRTFGWLLGGWLLWLLTSLGLLRHTVGFAWLSVGLVALAGIALGYRQRVAMRAFIRVNWPTLALGEILFGLAFLAFIWVRLQNPDLWQPWFGGEKQMELAFLNGILRSSSFPPLDPHFAGGVINYYYFGLYLVAYLIKLTGIHVEVAFNLAIPTLFALTFVTVFAIAYSAIRPSPGRPRWDVAESARGRADDWTVARRDLVQRPASGRMHWLAGVGAASLAPLYVTILGNLEGFAQLLRNLARLSPLDTASLPPGLQTLLGALDGMRLIAAGGASLPSYDFWGPSRVIEHTINEFPFWSFLFADLHPHLIGIPLAALYLAVLLVLLASPPHPWKVAWRRDLALLSLLALLLGALASVNLWELPTYLGLGLFTLVARQGYASGAFAWPRILLLGGLYATGAYLLFLPFFDTYVNLAASGLGLVKTPDPLGHWLLIWGFFVFVLLGWTLQLALGRSPEIDQGEPAVDLMRLLGLILITALFAALTGWIVLALCSAWLGLALAILWRRASLLDPGAALALILMITGLAILAGTQVVYLRDFLDGGDYYRMNTLFKFFNQVWPIWAVAAAIATPRLFQSWLGARAQDQSSRHPAKGVAQRLLALSWFGVFGLLLAASLTYPILGTPARLEQRMPGWRPPVGTLDGFDFMREGTYQLPGRDIRIELRHEWLALQWLLRHARDNAVILESSEVDYYRVGGTRMASSTGLSGLNGMHKSQQRDPREVEQRAQLHRALWSSTDPGHTQGLLETLQVDLVYVGQLERALHPEGARTFAILAEQGRLKRLYDNERVTIYAASKRMAMDSRGE